jgi:hypothetical protein
MTDPRGEAPSEARFKIGDQWYYRGNRSPSWFFVASRADGSCQGGISERVPVVFWPMLEEIASLRSATPANARAVAEVVLDNLPYLENLIDQRGHESGLLKNHPLPCAGHDFCLMRQAQKGADAIRAAATLPEAPQPAIKEIDAAYDLLAPVCSEEQHLALLLLHKAATLPQPATARSVQVPAWWIRDLIGEYDAEATNLTGQEFNDWCDRKAIGGAAVPPAAQRIQVPKGLVAALQSQKQCDPDGVECQVSRQAVDEAIAILQQVERGGRWCSISFPHQPHDTCDGTAAPQSETPAERCKEKHSEGATPRTATALRQLVIDHGRGEYADNEIICGMEDFARQLELELAEQTEAADASAKECDRLQAALTAQSASAPEKQEGIERASFLGNPHLCTVRTEELDRLERELATANHWLEQIRGAYVELLAAQSAPAAPSEQYGPCGICGFSDWPKDCPGRKNDDGTTCAYVGQLQRELAEACEHRDSYRRAYLDEMRKEPVSATPAREADELLRRAIPHCHGNALRMREQFRAENGHQLYAEAMQVVVDIQAYFRRADNTTAQEGKGA